VTPITALFSATVETYISASNAEKCNSRIQEVCGGGEKRNTTWPLSHSARKRN